MRWRLPGCPAGARAPGWTPGGSRRWPPDPVKRSAWKNLRRNGRPIPLGPARARERDSLPGEAEPARHPTGSRQAVLLLGALEFALGFLRQPQAPMPVTRAQILLLSRCGELLPGILPQRLQQPVTDLVSPLLGDDQGAPPQLFEALQHLGISDFGF